MDQKTGRLREALEQQGHLATSPVAIKLVRKEASPPRKVKYPQEHLGKRLAVCQGMSIARTFGWTMAFRDQDHACPMPRVFMGHIRPDKFLEGSVAEYYQADPECMRKMEASYPRWPLGRNKEVWLAPIQRCEFVPDLALLAEPQIPEPYHAISAVTDD